MRAGRARAGMVEAQRYGVHCGRPRREFPRDRARRLRTEGLSIRAIGALGIPASTVADALQPRKTAPGV